MKISDLREMTPEALKSELVASFKELFSLRMQKISAESANVGRMHRPRQIRRHIARIRTIMNEAKRVG